MMNCGTPGQRQHFLMSSCYDAYAGLPLLLGPDVIIAGRALDLILWRGFDGTSVPLGLVAE